MQRGDDVFYRYNFNSNTCNNNNKFWGIKCIQPGEPGRRRRRFEVNNKMDVPEVCCVNLDQIILRIDFLVDFYERGNERLGAIKYGEFLE